MPSADPVADVEADQQRGDRLDDARVRERAAVDARAAPAPARRAPSRARAAPSRPRRPRRTRRDRRGRCSRCAETFWNAETTCDALGHQRRHQLRARSLPDADRARRRASPTADASGTPIDTTICPGASRSRIALTCPPCARTAPTGSRSGARASASAFSSPSTRAPGTCLAHVRGRRDRALELARADHHRRARRAEAQREPEPLVARAAENRNRSVAHLGPRASRSISRTASTIRGWRRRPQRTRRPRSRNADPRALAIRWSDGAETVLDVRELRLACGCAECIDEWSGAGRLDPASRARRRRVRCASSRSAATRSRSSGATATARGSTRSRACASSGRGLSDRAVPLPLEDALRAAQAAADRARREVMLALPPRRGRDEARRLARHRGRPRGRARDPRDAARRVPGHRDPRRGVRRRGRRATGRAGWSTRSTARSPSRAASRSSRR